MNIFFDLDGTLIDSKERLYRLFQHLVPESNFTFEEYWEYKKARINHKEILNNQFKYSNTNIESFEKDWMSSIESSEWLNYDKPIEGIFEYLTKLKLKNDLYVVTARQSENMLKAQFENFKWTGIFKKIFITFQKYDKYDLIRDDIKVDKNDWFVGDTGLDILTGKKLGIKTAAVLSGFLSKDKLMEYNPDIIAENVMGIEFN